MNRLLRLLPWLFLALFGTEIVAVLGTSGPLTQMGLVKA